MKILNIFNMTTKQARVRARAEGVDVLELAKINVSEGEKVVFLYVVSLKKIIINIERN